MTNDSAPRPPLELRDYLQTLLRNWLVIILLTAIGGSVGYTIAHRTAPTYRAQVDLFVSASGGDNASELAQGSTFAQNVVQSYAALATSPAVLSEVINSAHLAMSPQALAGEITASVPTSTVIVQVDVIGRSPAQAAQVADAVGKSLSSVVVKLSPKTTKGTAAVNANVVAPAQAPSAPFAPNTKLHIELGAAAGLLVAIVFALLRRMLSTPDSGKRTLFTRAGERLRRRAARVKGGRPTAPGIAVVQSGAAPTAVAHVAERPDRLPAPHDRPETGHARSDTLAESFFAPL